MTVAVWKNGEWKYLAEDDPPMPNPELPGHQMSYEEFFALKPRPTLVSQCSYGYPSIMGQTNVDIFRTDDGRIVVYEFGNGGGCYTLLDE